MIHRISRVLLLTGATLVASNAYAGDPAAAQQLFSDAKKLISENKWADACPKLEESQRLDPGMGTQFNLANCYEHVGKTASAWAAFIEVAGQAKAAGQAPREKAARDRASILEPKLSKLTVTVRGTESGLKVTRDGIDVGRGQWGVALPIDPGEHRIAASAPGKKSFERVVRVAPDAKAVTVDVPALTDEPVVQAPVVVTPATGAAAPVAPATTTTTASTETSAPPAQESGAWSSQKTLGLVAGGIGLVGLGVGAGFGLASKAKGDDSGPHCIGDRCDADGVALRHEAVTNGTISTIAFVSGGVLLAGGAVLFLTAPKSDRSSTAARVQAAPLVGAGTTGLLVRGSF